MLWKDTMIVVSGRVADFSSHDIIHGQFMLVPLELRSWIIVSHRRALEQAYFLSEPFHVRCRGKFFAQVTRLNLDRWCQGCCYPGKAKNRCLRDAETSIWRWRYQKESTLPCPCPVNHPDCLPGWKPDWSHKTQRALSRYRLRRLATALGSVA